MSSSVRGQLLPRHAGLERWWVAACAVLLMVASDYDWRVRDVAQSLDGQVDLAVLLEIAIYGVVGAYVLSEVLRVPVDHRPRPLLVMVWGWGLTVAASAFYAPTPLMAFARGTQLLIACLLCQAIARYADREQLHRMVHAFIVLCVASVVVGVVAPFPKLALEADRFTFLYVHPVAAGTILGLGAVCAAAYVLSAGRGERWALWPVPVYLGASVVIGLGLLLTVTRSALGGAVAGIGLMAVVSSGRKRKLDVVVFGSVATALIVVLAGPDIIDFLSRGQSIEQLLTLNSRTQLWDFAAQQFAQRPLQGHGVTAARSLFLEDIGLGGSHNAAVEVAVSNGLIGLFWWLGLLALIIVGLVRLRTRGLPTSTDVILLSGVMAFLIVNGVATEGAGEPANLQSLWLLLVAGWVVVLQTHRGRELRPAPVSESGAVRPG